MCSHKVASGQSRFNDPYTSILFATWFCLCSSLIAIKIELAPVFYSFVGSFVVSFLVSCALRKYKLFLKSEKSAVNSIVALLHEILLLYFSLKWTDKSQAAILAITSGYCIFDLWDKTVHCLFRNKFLACEMVHHTLLIVWFIAAIYRDFYVPLALFVAPASLGNAISSIGTIIHSNANFQKISRSCFVTFIILRTFAYGSLLSYSIKAITFEEMPFCFLNSVLLNITNAVTFIALLSNFRKSIATTLCNPSETKVEKPNLNDPQKLWTVHGELYNLESFVNQHPGGSTAILLGKGRDCTVLFESYHPFTTKHRSTLTHFKVQQEGNESAVQKCDSDSFYEELCLKVRNTLEKVKIEPNKTGNIKASPRRFLYYGTILSCCAIMYMPFIQGNFLGTVLFSLATWLLGSLGHDGSHFAVSKYPILNDIACFAMTPLASPYMWLQQHTYAHHSFTNDQSHDPDLHHFSYLRTFENMPWVKYHIAQASRLYVYMWYTLVVFGEALWLPMKLILFGDISGILSVPNNSGLFSLAKQVLHVTIYVIAFLIVPISVSGSCASVFLFLSISGLLFGFFSQINHLNHDSMVNMPNDGGSWAKHQILTSNNFCTDSVFWSMISNNLNFQIEHHLFPGINHEHLWRIAPVVRDVCKAHRVKYKNFSSFLEILKETANYYKSLSRENSPEVSESPLLAE